MERLNSRIDPNAIADPVAGWAAGEYIRTLLPKVEELDRNCAAVREAIWPLRQLLRKK